MILPIVRVHVLQALRRRQGDSLILVYGAHAADVPLVMLVAIDSCARRRGGSR